MIQSWRRLSRRSANGAQADLSLRSASPSSRSVAVSSQTDETPLDGFGRRKQDRTKNKLHNRADDCGFRLDIEHESAIMCVQPHRPENAPTGGEAEHPSRQPDGNTWQRLREQNQPRECRSDSIKVRDDRWFVRSLIAKNSRRYPSR